MSGLRALLAALLVALLVAAVAPPARASVWSDASGETVRTEAHDVYEQNMLLGDDRAGAAVALERTLNQRELERRLDDAIENYQTAASARPTSGEPYARISKLLFSFYFEDCSETVDSNRSPLCPKVADPDVVNQLPWLHKRALQLIGAWDAFEQRAPLDPRIDWRLLFQRAILHTQLGAHDDLVAAARDYEAALKVSEDTRDVSLTTNNLAETYMMLGRLDDAVAMYRTAVAVGADDAVFGLAVALDRDERPDSAREVILEAGPQAYATLVQRIYAFEIFFVPPAERFYYLALCAEAYDDVDEAIANWQQFIKSGVYPMYQPRAKAHLDNLLLQRKLHPQILRPTVPYDPYEQ